MWVTQQIDIIVTAAFGEFIRLHIFEADDRLSHDATVPITAHTLLAYIQCGYSRGNQLIIKSSHFKCIFNRISVNIIILTSIIVAHADIVADHMRHCASQQMRFVYVCLNADTNGFIRTHRILCGNASFTARKSFTTAYENKTNKNQWISTTFYKQKNPLEAYTRKNWILLLSASWSMCRQGIINGNQRGSNEKKCCELKTQHVPWLSHWISADFSNSVYVQ